ncbi:hypothetical protein GCM10025870_27830 [Agromyces marinus]|uniref:Uncharacterized protein n=1 Tax=Agromyces marinus TaxID=1389020 RepID=A0ABN6YHX1_9MICO|nr:hypothetical protein GCM10025870_27830 [Agromyces marinus]
MRSGRADATDQYDLGMEYSGCAPLMAGVEPVLGRGVRMADAAVPVGAAAVGAGA